MLVYQRVTVKGFGIIFVFRFRLFLICYDLLFCPFSGNLQHFGTGSCRFSGIATFWSSNLSFSMVFATFWCSNFSCWMVFCDESSFKVCLGLFLGVISDWFRVVSFLGGFVLFKV